MKLKIFGILGVLCLIASPSVADDDVESEDFGPEEFEEEYLYEYEYEYDDEIQTDETRGVTARLTCAEINERVEELRADVKMYPELATDLETMLARQRNQCAPQAKHRPVRNYMNINPVTVVEGEPEEVITEVPDEVIEPEPEKTPEEIAAAAEIAAENLANGLCADGAKPNRYGCCVGYKFKEVSQMKFACCTPDDVCMEPIVKK